MEKKLISILLSLAVVVFGCGIIYGMTSVDVTNYFETGIVDIDLSEYCIDGGKEMPLPVNPILMPGDSLSQVSRIKNYGNDCYVRAKIAFRDTTEFTIENIVGISEDWILAEDGYYYYKNILPTGEEVNIFSGVNIPKDLPQYNEGAEFFLDVSVDAIQSKNFEPDFSLAMPWGSVQILMNNNIEPYDVSTFKVSDTKNFQIVYQGAAEKLVINSEDFFANFPYLMPGDTYADEVIIKNDSNDIIKLHFRSVTEDSDLLKRINLKISTNISGTYKVVYEGDLQALKLVEDTILGELKGKKECSFKFEISVPAELTNEYNLSASSVKWIFSTEVTKIPDNPKTGDISNVYLYFGMMSVSFMCIVLLLFARFKQEKEEETQQSISQ